MLSSIKQIFKDVFYCSLTHIYRLADINSQYWLNSRLTRMHQYENVLFERLWCRTSCLASFLIIKSQESYRTFEGSLPILTSVYDRLLPDIRSSIAKCKAARVEGSWINCHSANQSSAPDPSAFLSACHNICSKSETCCFRVSQPPQS